MTRINCGIKPSELSDRHLLAEHREIKRIPNLIRAGKYNLKDKPDKYTLGKGHVKFFYDKLKYLTHRYCDLHKECKRRGFNVTNFIGAFINYSFPYELYRDYTETLEDRLITLDRLIQKDKNYRKLIEK